jgi:hypothetical protein
MTYSPQSWANNDATKPLSAARMSVIETGIYDAHVRPSVRAVGVLQSITTATVTALTFTAADRYDNGLLHDPAVNPSRITFTVPGVYVLAGFVEFVANATGYREAGFRVNGTILIGSTNIPTNSASVVTRLNPTAQYQFAASDYVELIVTQTSGGNLNVNATGNLSPEFAATLSSYL